MKSQVRRWLVAGEFQQVIHAALEQDRIISALITLTYDVDPLIGWRAIDAIGRCAECISEIRPGSLKNYLRRLFWMMSDESGSVVWHAPEAIGEIIRSDPRIYADFIPMAVSLLEMEPEDRPSFLPGILYSLGRIGEVLSHSVDAGLTQIIDALAENNEQARAMAVWCLGRLHAKNPLLQRPSLALDQGRALIYRNEFLVETTIGVLLSEALNAQSYTEGHK